MVEYRKNTNCQTHLQHQQNLICYKTLIYQVKYGLCLHYDKKYMRAFALCWKGFRDKLVAQHHKCHASSKDTAHKAENRLFYVFHVTFCTLDHILHTLVIIL